MFIIRQRGPNLCIGQTHIDRFCAVMPIDMEFDEHADAC